MRSSKYFCRKTGSKALLAIYFFLAFDDTAIFVELSHGLNHNVRVLLDQRLKLLENAEHMGSQGSIVFLKTRSYLGNFLLFGRCLHIQLWQIERRKLELVHYTVLPIPPDFASLADLVVNCHKDLYRASLALRVLLPENYPR